MVLDLAASRARVVSQLPCRRVEGGVDGGGQVVLRLPVDSDLVARHTEVYSDLEQGPSLVMPVGSVDNHPTTCEPVVETLELRCLLLDQRLGASGDGKVMPRDLQWNL